MTGTVAHTSHDVSFGAKPHDEVFWRDHPMVSKSEVHIDDDFGWVGLCLKAAEPDGPAVKAGLASPEETREGPDLYFFGEGECPVSLFEHAPQVSVLRISIEGAIEGDQRACWSAGLWLRGKVR
jgi:hypothetical protein